MYYHMCTGLHVSVLSLTICHIMIACDMLEDVFVMKNCDSDMNFGPLVIHENHLAISITSSSILSSFILTALQNQPNS